MVFSHRRKNEQNLQYIQMRLEDQNFDFSRNDKLYEFTIPTFTQNRESVFYELHLKDLLKNQQYITLLRFNDLKQFHEKNQKLKFELPEFPKTHFWRKTNNNPEMIEERRRMLANYFQVVLNDPSTRGTPEVKKFVGLCKSGLKQRRSLSCRRPTESTGRSKSMSVTTPRASNKKFTSNLA